MDVPRPWRCRSVGWPGGWIVIGVGGAALLAALAAGSLGPGDDVRVLADDGRDDRTRLAQGLVLDRLIRQGGTVAPEVLVRRFDHFRHEVTILLASHPRKPIDAWLQLLNRSNVGGPQWLAFANALLRVRAPPFAGYLLAALPKKLEVRVFPLGRRGGPISGIMLGTPARGAGARRPCYEVATYPRSQSSGWVVFSTGPHPVYYRRDESEGEAYNCGHCLAEDSGRRHLGDYLAHLSGLPAFEMDPFFDSAVSAGAEESVEGIEARARAGRARAFERVAAKLVQLGLLDRAPALPPVEIAVIDERAPRVVPATSPGAPPVSSAAQAESPRMWWRIVAKRDGRPVREARVYLVEPLGRRPSGPTSEASVQAVSDGEGFIQLEVPLGAELARVEAAGFAPTLFALRPGHQQRAQAVSIPLGQGARVPVEVVDRGGSPLAGVTILLSGYVPVLESEQVFAPDLRWTCQTNRAGTCWLAGLPPETALRMQVTRPNGVTRGQPNDVVLRPGDNPAIRVRFGRASLSGVIVGENGKALSGQEIWLVPVGAVCGDKNADRFLFDSSDEDNVSARATSDGAGSFTFPDVGPGVWWLGPAPRPRSFVRERPDGPTPLATKLTLSEYPPPTRITIKASRPHFITGKVVAASGEPAPAIVTAVQPGLGTCNGLRNGSGEGAWTGPGRFELGPLPAGGYTLHAGRDFGAGTPANAGATDVLLQLPRTGSIVCRVEDKRTRQQVRPAAIGSWNGERSRWITQIASDDFELRDLQPGRYALWARTADGRVGILEGVEVTSAGRKTPPVVIPVEPGARLRVFYSGPDRYAQLKVIYRGIPVAADGIHTDTSSVQQVPAGPLTVRLRLENRSPEEREILLAPGEHMDLSFRIAP